MSWSTCALLVVFLGGIGWSGFRLLVHRATVDVEKKLTTRIRRLK